MDLALMEPQNLPKPHKFDHLIGENYSLALNQSIQALIDSLHKPTFIPSDFTSTFHDLLLARVNPPLENIWVYSNLVFRSSNGPKVEPLDRFTAVKDLFQLITSCSGGSWTSVACIAPVVYELYRVIVDFRGEKKVVRKIRSLVNVILGYINLCYSDTEKDVGNDGALVRPLEELVSFWIGEGNGNGGVKERVGSFFPLLDDETVEMISGGGFGVGELAGAVMVEVFLMKLCLECREGIKRDELRNKLRTWAVGSITGFRNIDFFGTLVKMLLVPNLPVTSLLNSEDASFLRQVLFDAVILVDYSFLSLEKVAHLPSKTLKGLAVARLMVAYEAIELARKGGNHTKAISYNNAFSNSHLSSLLIVLVNGEVGMEGKPNKPNGSSPQAFLKWLLNLEDQGIRILDEGMSDIRARLVLDNLKAGDDRSGYKVDGMKSDTDILFYIDIKGKEEERTEDENPNDSMNAAFVAAAHTMQLAENGVGRKRRKRRRVGKKRVKLLKPDLDEPSGSSWKKSANFSKDDSNSESEIDNPI
ncbi:hypothetical protein RJ639_018544 [Escallonia herrerae]|uniref:Uncharacterized protein n=1 Tax=Escallonia herrerae TaxID=1293975 RepID=A0AA88VBD3_9ASTE|nr:hypothetical protein RJ639_018544 [Escallonia herrerae]